VKQFKSFIYLAIVLLFVSGCEVPDDSPKALVNIFLMDSPAQWDSVVVEIEGVEIEFVQSARQGETQKIWLPYEPAKKTINLSKLVNGITLPVSRKEFQLGQITAITLRLGTSHALFQGDNRFELVLPSEVTDFKKDLKVDLEDGISYDLVLDMDLEKSIQVVQQEPLKLSFNPTIYAFSGIGRGEVIGTVFPMELKPAIFAISGKDSVSTHTNTGGGFLFRLQPGFYNLYIDPKDNRYFSETLPNIEVKTGQPTNLERVTLKKK
jgi:hypothetical protein